MTNIVLLPVLCVHFIILWKFVQWKIEKLLSIQSWSRVRKRKHQINRLDELKRANIKMTRKDFRLLRKYEILVVTVEGITVQKLRRKGTQL